MKSKTLVLLNAKELISKPEKWSKEAFARSKYNKAVGWDSPRAICWCALGAVYKTNGYHGDFTNDAVSCLENASQEKGYGLVAHLNDDPKTKHSDVMKLYERAIELSENSK